MSLNWSKVEARYGVAVPEAVKTTYGETDGERALVGGWRRHSIAELLELNWEDGWLNNKTAGEYAKTLGGLLPLYTNDGSDLLVLHCAGPLEGRLVYCSHQDSDLFIVAHSVKTFEAERAKGSSPVRFSQYVMGSVAEKNQGIRAVEALRASLNIPKDVDLEYLAHVWKALRGGYPQQRE